MVVGIGIAVDGVEKIIQVCNGETLAQPGWIAFWAAIASIVLKELNYWLTIRVAKQVDSEALRANAWHHRSDALSSIGTGLGIGGAILLGQRWTILDPIAALVVSVFVVLTALRLTYGAIGEFLEQSLPEENENEIRAIVAADKELSELHHLCTRRLGNRVAIEMHLRMPGNTPLTIAHKHASAIEQQLKQRFGDQTHINIHLEPTKVNGKYEE